MTDSQKNHTQRHANRKAAGLRASSAVTAALFALFLLFGIAARAQVKVVAAIDSTEMLIGEQTAVRIDVTHPAGAEPVFPSDLQQLMNKGVEVIGSGVTGTESAAGAETTHFAFTVTSFDPALYSIPSLSVKVGKRTYATQPLALKVNDVKVDTANVDKYFGPKEIIEPVYTWRDWMPLFVLSLLLIAGIAAVAVAARRLKQTKALPRPKPAPKPAMLPHEEAQMLIAKLKEQHDAGQLAPKDYYTDLVAILRRYVGKRYGFRTDEMTSRELVEHLIDNASTAEGEQRPDYAELREILATADLAKFAKLQPEAGEDERNLGRLQAYVETTKSDTPPPAPPQEEEEEKPQEPSTWPRRRKQLALAAAVALTAVVAALIIAEIFELLL
jgi:hypothetical protein